MSGRLSRWALALFLLGGAMGGCAGPQRPRPGPLPPSLPPPGAAEDPAGEPAGPGAAGRILPPGEGPLRLTVEAAALAALDHNRDLRIGKLAPVIAGAFAQIARGRYDTELFAEGRLGHERAVETARSTEERFDVRGSQISDAVGARQSFASGTEVEIGLEHSFSDSSRTPEQHRARLGLTLTQALLQGLSPAVNLAAIEQADLEVQASRYELRGYTEAVLAAAEIAYWRFVLAEREIAIHEKTLRVAKKQRDEIRQEIEVGTMAQTESAAACAEVALREQDLIDARSVLAQRRLRLLRLLGAPLDQEILAVSDPAIEAAPIHDLEDRLQLAMRSRAEINEALLRLEQRRLETVVTRDGVLPRLDLFIQLGKTGFDEDFGGSFRKLGSRTFDVLGGLSFSVLVQNRAADGAERAAFASHRQASQAVDNLREQVRLEVRLAVSEVERARQQIGASAATRALQEQKVMVEQERFRVGESTALILAQAQRDLLSSRIAEIEALVDYRCALVALYLAEGSLLERRGIRIAR